MNALRGLYMNFSRIAWRILTVRQTAWWPAMPSTPPRWRTSAMPWTDASPRSRAWLQPAVQSSTSPTAFISSSGTWMMRSLGSSKWFHFLCCPFLGEKSVNGSTSAAPFFREKKLLVGSEDYGRDLTGVQNLRKKHKRLEAELGAHEPAIQVTFELHQNKSFLLDSCRQCFDDQ